MLLWQDATQLKESLKSKTYRVTYSEIEEGSMHPIGRYALMISTEENQYLYHVHRPEFGVVSRIVQSTGLNSQEQANLNTIISLGFLGRAITAANALQSLSPKEQYLQLKYMYLQSSENPLTDLNAN